MSAVDHELPNRSLHPATDMPQYYIRRDGEIYGPLSAAALRKAAAGGKVRADDRVSTSQTGPWRKAGSVANLFGDTTRPQDRQPPPPAADPTADFEDLIASSSTGEELEEQTRREAVPLQADEPPADGPDWEFEESEQSFGRDLLAEIVPREGMPREIQELIPADEEIYFADHPAKVVLYIRIALSVFAWFLLFLSYRGIAGFVTSSLVVRYVIPAGLLLMWLYLLYGSWVNTFYAITGKRVIYRGGWFNRRIRIIPVHNVQEVSVNTGLIDRWLNLNTVSFSSAASPAINVFGKTGISFRSVSSRHVLRALQRAG